METDVRNLVRAGINVELLVPSDMNDTMVGVRLRTYGKNLPKNKMVLGSGATFKEALKDALTKAGNGRWESLEWAARPWEVKDRRDLNVLAGYGLS